MPFEENTAFDLSRATAALAEDIRRRVPPLSHIDPERILFCLSRSLSPGVHGTYARIVPLRFPDGTREKSRRRGRYLETFRMPAMEHEGRKILYLIYLFIPRFLRLPFEEKLATIFHELYHISEKFDGDIRRFPGRNYAHGASRREFHRRVSELATAYLETRPDPSLLRFLRMDEKSWREGRLRLSGLSVALPRARLADRRPL